MNRLSKVTAIVLSLTAMGSIQQAEAGCVKGAIIGGLAGHMLGRHGVVGAATGCAIGAATDRRRNYDRRDDYGRNDDRRGNGDFRRSSDY